jgi:hypothetical protein
MVRTQIYLTEEEHTKLKSMSRKYRKKHSELIRTAIDLYLAGIQETPRRELIRSCLGIWKGRPDTDFQNIRVELSERVIG